MTNLRQAAQQALETLEEINELSIGENAICLPAEIDTAMDALRAALVANLVAAHKTEVAIAEAYRCGYKDGMEAAAVICDEYEQYPSLTLRHCAEAIRARNKA